LAVVVHGSHHRHGGTRCNLAHTTSTDKHQAGSDSTHGSSRIRVRGLGVTGRKADRLCLGAG
jgi:hypothetical protein